MESLSSSSGNSSPQSSPQNLRKQKQTPFLSELLEKKKSRKLEIEENDYTENPIVVGQKGKFRSDGGNDIMRRALLLTNSLPDRLQFAIKSNQSSSADKNRSSMESLTPPPVPPRPLPCNRIPSGFELRNTRWHERELPLRSQSRSQNQLNSSRVPPPRPPKSASVIALMMTNPHHVNTNNSVPNRPSHSLRDRRGDVIEVSESCRLIRGCQKKNTTCAITMQPSNVMSTETERLLPVNVRVKINPNDDIAEQKRQNKIEAENCELLAQNVAQNKLTEEKPCPHCGKNINEIPFQQQDDKKKAVTLTTLKPDVDVERAESLARCECSCRNSVELLTCMWCVKSCFYHCSEEGGEQSLWADKPCACHGLHCQRRWLYMVFMFFIFPLIILYPLFRLVSDSCCKPEERKKSSRASRAQQRNNSNNYTPAPTFS